MTVCGGKRGGRTVSFDLTRTRRVQEGGRKRRTLEQLDLEDEGRSSGDDGRVTVGSVCGREDVRESVSNEITRERREEATGVGRER